MTEFFNGTHAIAPGEETALLQRLQATLGPGLAVVDAAVVPDAAIDEIEVYLACRPAEDPRTVVNAGGDGVRFPVVPAPDRAVPGDRSPLRPALPGASPTAAHTNQRRMAQRWRIACGVCRDLPLASRSRAAFAPDRQAYAPAEPAESDASGDARVRVAAMTYV